MKAALTPFTVTVTSGCVAASKSSATPSASASWNAPGVPITGNCRVGQGEIARRQDAQVGVRIGQPDVGDHRAGGVFHHRDGGQHDAGRRVVHIRDATLSACTELPPCPSETSTSTA